MSPPPAKSRQRQQHGSIKRVCEDPRFADGREDEDLVMQHDGFPPHLIALLNDPDKQGETGEFTTPAPPRAASRRGDHHADIAIDGKIHIAREGGQEPDLRRAVHDEESQDGTES